MTCEHSPQAPVAEDLRATHNGNDPAYSSPSFVSPQGDIAWGAPGLTKRELFAAMALQGRLSSGGWESVEEVAKDSVFFADALLKELAR